jgi:hypothetical protein
MVSALALAVVALAIGAIVVGPSTATAELENQVFISKPDRIRIVVPRGWRATDQPSYPGLLLWMLRGQPEGKIVLTAEPFSPDVSKTWPVACRTAHESLPAKYACALRQALQGQHMRVQLIQAGPKENEEGGLPSVWFEYESTDGKRFFRQAVAVRADRVVSLVLAAPSNEARAAHVRAFEQALRTLRNLTAEELGTTGAPDDAGVAATPSPADAATDASAAPSDASLPPAKVDPIDARSK